MRRHHTVTVEFEPMGPTAEMTCTAPAHAHCRARYDCDCETWLEAGVDDGRPYHVAGDWSENLDERHYGVFDPAWCNEVEWFDACDGLDNTTGKITFAVETEWEGEHYTWHVDPPRPEAEIHAERLATALALAVHDAHPTYGSTAMWHGGLGGQTLTSHCSIVNGPPPGDDWTQCDLLSTPLRDWVRSREADGDPFDLDAAKVAMKAELNAQLLPPGACTECRHRWNEHDVDGSCDHYPCQCPGYRRTE